MKGDKHTPDPAIYLSPDRSHYSVLDPELPEPGPAPCIDLSGHSSDTAGAVSQWGRCRQSVRQVPSVRTPVIHDGTCRITAGAVSDSDGKWPQVRKLFFGPKKGKKMAKNTLFWKNDPTTVVLGPKSCIWGVKIFKGWIPLNIRFHCHVTELFGLTEHS